MTERAQICQAVDYERCVSRRLMLAWTAGLSSIPSLARASWADARPALPENPFQLGVASGDPAPDGMVLWTRLAMRPLDPDGGMPAVPMIVRWYVSAADSPTQVLRSGESVATPQLSHSVHVELAGLEPDRWYSYWFTCGDYQSPIGRTRTTPVATALPAQLRFAFASCQHFEDGFYAAYAQMARDQLDLVVHLGDYIYEGAGRDNRLRRHIGGEIQTLSDYRVRLSQYRSDTMLQNMHAQCPWLVTWDDHELDNNYASDISEQADVSPAELLVRRTNAYQAYYEMMPLRASALPRGADMQLYRQVGFGRLANFMVLDTRQYRTDQPNNDRKSPLNAAALAPTNSLLGPAQRGWLQAALLQSGGLWNVLAQQVMMAFVAFPQPNAEAVLSMDQWPGAAAERMNLMRFLSERRVPNPIVLTGDIHCNWVNDLRIDDRQPEQPVVATEFVGTSISSGGNGAAKAKDHDALLAANPVVRFYNRQRGYVRCQVTPDRWTSDYMVVADVTQPDSDVTPCASFVVEAGTPGAHPA